MIFLEKFLQTVRVEGRKLNAATESTNGWLLGALDGSTHLFLHVLPTHHSFVSFDVALWQRNLKTLAFTFKANNIFNGAMVCMLVTGIAAYPIIPCLERLITSYGNAQTTLYLS